VLTPGSAGQANADEWFGILVARDWLAGWELGICKIFNTVSILAESRRIIPTEPVIESDDHNQCLEEEPGGPQPIGLLLDEL
jgi:hypothetical protein